MRTWHTVWNVFCNHQPNLCQMELSEFKAEFRRRISKAFFGHVPEPFSLLEDESIEAYYAFIMQRSDNNVYEINFAEYIEDLIGQLMPSLKPILEERETPGKKELKQFAQANRILFGSQFYKAIQDPSLPDAEKIEICFFMDKLLDTGTKMYGIDLVENQPAFLRDINSSRVEITSRIQAPSLELPPPYVCSNTWPYSIEELERMSEALFAEHFTVGREAFLRAFEGECNMSGGPCEWKGKTTSLMFLFGLLVGNLEERRAEYLTFISERFVFSGNRKSGIKNLREALRQASATLDMRPQELQGESAKIHAAHSKAFPRK